MTENEILLCRSAADSLRSSFIEIPQQSMNFQAKFPQIELDISPAESYLNNVIEKSQPKEEIHHGKV